MSRPFKLTPYVVPEDAVQRAYIDWVKRAEQTTHPELVLLFHCPNGGKRHKITAAQLKAMGVRPGVPDILLPLPRGPFHGLAIEFKRPGCMGHTTPEQKAFLAGLEAAGWLVQVVTDAAVAVALTQKYLALGAHAP